MESKICSLCKELKEAVDFPTSKSGKLKRHCYCKICTSVKNKQYYENNKHKVLSRQKVKTESLTEEELSIRRGRRTKTSLKHYYKDINKGRRYRSEYRRNNTEKYAKATARYRALKNTAIPSWANTKYINLFYQLANEDSKITGKKVHVDHIVPLNSPYVCGFHCEDNLQLLFSDKNISKGNRWWPDMWE